MVVKIQKKKYVIPTSWNEVTCSQFQSFLLAQDIFDKITCLTGIPKSTVENLDWPSVQTIQTAISFSNDFTLLDGVNVYPKEFEGFEISKQPAKTILQVHGVMKKARELTDDEFLQHIYCGVDIMSIYIDSAKEQLKDSENFDDISGINIYNEPITKWYGLMCFFLSKWVSFSIDTAIYQTTHLLNTNYKPASKTSLISRRISGLLNRLWKSSNKVQTTS